MIKLMIYRSSVLALLCLSSVQLFGNSLLDSAESAYDRQDYQKAILYYDSLLKLDPNNSDLQFNIGNAYFKNREIPKSILHYERALKIDPKHDDAIYNLRLANEKTVDKIEAIPDLFIYRWWRSIYNLYTADEWARISVALLILCLIGFTIFLFMKEVQIRKIGFYGGLFNLVFALFCILLATNQHSYMKSTSHAIIMSPTVNVISSPSAGSSQLFVLHEGTKVSVKSADKNWVQIALPNGNEGWVDKQQLESI